ncbi:MAG: EI24 domain-containing protein [Archangium sp.]
MTDLLPKEGSASDLMRGFGFLFRAISVIFTTPKLLALSLLCALVTAITLFAIGSGSWSLGQGLAEKWIGADGGWRHAASLGLGFVFFAVFFAVGALTIPNLILSPLQDPISEATEVKLGNFVAPPFTVAGTITGILSSLRHTLARLLLMALGYLVLFPLNLIPVAGSVIYVVLSSLWAMFWLAVEHLSNPMARHLRPFRQVIGVMRKRIALSLGFGAALYVLLWVPVLNCFLMPIAVVAGTLLYRALADVNAFPPNGNEDPSRVLGVP